MAVEGDIELAVLRQIARGAPLQELLDVIASPSAARKLTDATREALEAAATEVCRAREADRRRLRGMDLLNETAVDLASLKNLDQILAAICARARHLLDSDVAYIALVDRECGDTYVRATNGVAHDEFREMRLPFGVGLGGRVAKDSVAVYTEDYGADSRFAHTSDIDYRVALEGLRAIVGVPICRRELTVGVLMSGSRSVRRFEAAELSLFQALATHASVAIENARLFEQAQSSLGKLERSNTENRQAAALHERLATLAVEGAGAAELTSAVEELVGGRLSLMERNEDGSGPSPPDEAITIDVVAGTDRLAYLVWWPDKGANREQGAELLRRGAAIFAGQFLSRRRRSEANYRRGAEVVAALFDEPHADATRVARELGGVGLTSECPHTVLVAEIPAGKGRWGELRAAKAASEAGGIARTNGSVTTLVVPGDDTAAIGSQWERVLMVAGDRPNIGIGGSAVGVEGIRRSQREAVASLNLLRSLGRAGATARSDELGLLPLVFGRGRPDEVSGFVDHVLGPLIASDGRRREPILVPTLEAYFAAGGRVTPAARLLGVHVNTLYQRLDRVSKLIGVDWREYDRSLEVQFALRARTLVLRGSSLFTAAS